jgi:ribonuclease HI
MATAILCDFPLDGNPLFSSTPLVRVYTDGSCEPRNPGGYACWGWIAHDAGCLGHGPVMTNNVAEAQAILEALHWATSRQIQSLVLLSDSQLLVNQVRGAWAVNASHLVPLVQEARELLAALNGHIRWIPRDENCQADALCRRAYRAIVVKGGVHD